MSKILNWWNSLPFCRQKKMTWFASRSLERTGLLQSLYFPENKVIYPGEEFKESDWVYTPGDRCERYICWFFHYFTERCTVLERTPIFLPATSRGGAGGSHPDEYITGYKVKNDDETIISDVYQSNLSY